MVQNERKRIRKKNEERKNVYKKSQATIDCTKIDDDWDQHTLTHAHSRMIPQPELSHAYV